ncbi:hypothetical protein [uncultured Sphingomonas sp.]|nr:hypothetical protein [uncultured Sphingomonas sp.]
MAEKLVNESGFAMIDVRDDGDIAQLHRNSWNGRGPRGVRAPLAYLLRCG